MIGRLYERVFRDVLIIHSLAVVAEQLPFVQLNGTWSAYSKNIAKLAVMLADDVLAVRMVKK